MSNEETIALLQNTIEQLEAVIAKLNTEPSTSLASSDELEAIVKNTEELAVALELEPLPTTVTTSADTATPDLELDFDLELPTIPSETEPEIPEFLSNLWGTLVANWQIVGVTLATILVIISAVTFLSRAPEETTPVAVKIPETPVVEEELNQNQLDQEEIVPEQPAKLTPEQSLIAAIQEQVAQLTSQYEDNLVLTVQANFLSSNLRVNVSDDWYELKRSRQQKIADKMLDRSRKLDFKKLLIADAEGNTVARSPVVGREMLLFSAVSRPTTSDTSFDSEGEIERWGAGEITP